MRRREFIAVLSGGLGHSVLWPLGARAQQQQHARTPRVGVLWHAGSAEQEGIYIAAFRQGMVDHGYVEGQNVIVEHRFPAEMPERFKSMADELVALKMDVLVGAGQPPALALQRATSTIPIVFATTYDPIGVGLVDNLARPTGNITGLSLPDLIGKRLELFKQAVPGLLRVAILVNSTNPSYARRYGETVQADTTKLALAVQVVDVNGPDDIERAFSSIEPEANLAVAAAADVMFYNERERITKLALAQRLPSVFHNEEFVKVGGLLSYGANVPALFRRSADYVDKILKGGKPADLPVEEPTQYRMFINLKTARMLGLTISPSFLTFADNVIE